VEKATDIVNDQIEAVMSSVPSANAPAGEVSDLNAEEEPEQLADPDDKPESLTVIHPELPESENNDSVDSELIDDP